MTRNQIILILVVLAVVGGVVALFIFGSKTTDQQLSGTLNFWGVFDSRQVMDPVIGAYRTKYQGVQINYFQINSSTYESDLINALAGANPPDIFMIHNSWLPKHFNKILPFNQISVNNLRQIYPSVVEQDFAPDGVVYALPLYIDTLATYYNQDIFDNKGVAVPPKTWKELESLIPKLREIDKQGRIQKPAAAIGGTVKSVNRATDLLNLLMLQSGAKMVNDNYSGAEFNSQEGLEALAFYTKFANPANPSYAWSDSFAHSIDSFASGETAIMFNYAYQSAFLKEKNPFLNFRIVPMLQPESRTQDVNFANYWGMAVSNKTRLSPAAQSFAAFLTTDPQGSQLYLQNANRPPALRGLINQYLNNPEFGVFAKQALTARSWPQPDNVAIENIFNEMIDSVLSGRSTLSKALEEAENKVTELLQRRQR